MSDKPDYLAITLIGAGSSYARGSDIQDVVKRLGKTIVSDWGKLYDVKGKPCEVSLFNITGIDSVFWDGTGVHPSDRPQECLPPMDRITITLPSR